MSVFTQKTFDTNREGFRNFSLGGSEICRYFSKIVLELMYFPKYWGGECPPAVNSSLDTNNSEISERNFDKGSMVKIGLDRSGRKYFLVIRLSRFNLHTNDNP